MQSRCVCQLRGTGPLRLRQTAWRATSTRSLSATRCRKVQATGSKVRSVTSNLDCISAWITKMPVLTRCIVMQGHSGLGNEEARVTGRRKCRQTHQISCQATKTAEKLEDDVAASDEVLPNGVKRLHITVPAGKVAKAWEKAIRLEGRSHDFPGFRQGKKASI